MSESPDANGGTTDAVADKTTAELEAKLAELQRNRLAGPTLAERIAGAMGEAGEVTKSDENREQGYKFASAESILKAVREPLLERGILLFPHVDELVEHEITSRGGTKGTRVVIGVTYRFTDGREELVAKWRGEGQDYGDKAYGKAFTNALKTFIRSAWLLPTEHDDPEARPSGDRVSAGGAELPAWARKATPARMAELPPVLAPVLGVDRTRAMLQAIKGTLGEVPDVAIATLKLAGAYYTAALEELGALEDAKRERLVLEEQAAADAKAKAEADAAQAAAEEPDSPAPGDAGEPVTQAELAETSGPAPGSVVLDPPLPASAPPAAIEMRLRNEGGCTCTDPVVAHEWAGSDELPPDDIRGFIDDNCPVHGIAF